MIGYPQGIKGYKLLDLHTHEVFVSRDVVFHEKVFHFHEHTLETHIKDPFEHIPLPIVKSVDIPNPSQSLRMNMSLLLRLIIHLWINHIVTKALLYLNLLI